MCNLPMVAYVCLVNQQAVLCAEMKLCKYHEHCPLSTFAVEHDESLIWAQYTVSTLLVVVSSQHLISAWSLWCKSENSSSKAFSSIGELIFSMSVNVFQLLVCCHGSVQCLRQQVGHNRKQGAAGGDRRRQEAAGGGQVARCHVSRSDDRKLHTRCCRCVATLGNTHLTLLHSSHWPCAHGIYKLNNKGYNISRTKSNTYHKKLNSIHKTYQKYDL